jgi:ribosomal protein S18 acetylase RimI-like enzyme
MNKSVGTLVERLVDVVGTDLEDLCEAANQAILDGNGFGWLSPPPRQVMENYWRGVLMVPERELFVARLDSQIVGSAQLLKPPPNNEAGAHIMTLMTFFVAPWARGLGLARGLLVATEQAARAAGFLQLDLDVRETQEAAIKLYEEAGFTRWAVREKYARIDGQFVTGYFYTKDLARSPKVQQNRRKKQEKTAAQSESMA